MCSWRTLLASVGIPTNVTDRACFGGMAAEDLCPSALSAVRLCRARARDRDASKYPITNTQTQYPRERTWSFPLARSGAAGKVSQPTLSHFGRRRTGNLPVQERMGCARAARKAKRKDHEGVERAIRDYSCIRVSSWFEVVTLCGGRSSVSVSGHRIRSSSRQSSRCS